MLILFKPKLLALYKIRQIKIASIKDIFPVPPLLYFQSELIPVFFLLSDTIWMTGVGIDSEIAENQSESDCDLWTIKISTYSFLAILKRNFIDSNYLIV